MPSKPTDNRPTDKTPKRTRQKAATKDNSSHTTTPSTETTRSDTADTDEPVLVKRPRIDPVNDSQPENMSNPEPAQPSSIASTAIPPTDPLHAVPTTSSTNQPRHASPPTAQPAEPNSLTVNTEIPTDNINDNNDGTPISGWNASGDEDGNPDDNNVQPVPDTVDNHAEFRNVNYVPIPTLQRALAFATMEDSSNNRYAITRVPTTARWGSTPATERVLCHNERPLTIWLVGVVATTWFTNSAGQPHQRVNIGIRLPHVHDALHARNMFKRSRPERAYTQDVFYASKYMGRQTRGSAEVTAMPFQDIFDAQHRFRAKREMSLMPAAYIAKNDLVLVEAAFTRWKSAKDKKNNKNWTIWDVGFELQAVSLLFEAPPAPEDNEFRANDNIHDDL